MNVRRAALLVPLAALLALPASGKIDVTVDAESLNGMLQSMAPNTVDVNLAAGRKLTLHLEDLKITGFDPTAGPNGGLTASLRLVVPDLGLDVPVTPHLRLDISESGGNGRKESFLRFDKVVLNLPLTGPVDVASLLPPLTLLPDAAWMVDSARGKVRVRPVLIDGKAGTKNIRLTFDLRLDPAGPN